MSRPGRAWPARVGRVYCTLGRFCWAGPGQLLGNIGLKDKRTILTVMGKILFKSILSTSTSTQPKKYLKYKCKYIISKVSKIQIQNTAPKKYLKYSYQNTCWGAKSNCSDIYGND